MALRLRGLGVLLVAVLLLAACSNQTANDQVEAGSAGAQTEVATSTQTESAATNEVKVVHDQFER